MTSRKKKNRSLGDKRREKRQAAEQPGSIPAEGQADNAADNAAEGHEASRERTYDQLWLERLVPASITPQGMQAYRNFMGTGPAGPPMGSFGKNLTAHLTSQLETALGASRITLVPTPWPRRERGKTREISKLKYRCGQCGWNTLVLSLREPVTVLGVRVGEPQTLKHCTNCDEGTPVLVREEENGE